MIQKPRLHHSRGLSPEGPVVTGVSFILVGPSTFTVSGHHTPMLRTDPRGGRDGSAVKAIVAPTWDWVPARTWQFTAIQNSNSLFRMYIQIHEIKIYTYIK